MSTVTGSSVRGSSTDDGGPEGDRPASIDSDSGESRGRRVLSWLRRLPSAVLVLGVRGYQLVVSPWLPASCKYYPSCSQYAVVALQRHGLVRGTGLAIWRLLRCNPWSSGGVDDVPERSPGTSHAHHQHER